jgi:hypothetical protein
METEDFILCLFISGESDLLCSGYSAELTDSGWLDSLLMGIVITQTITYSQFIRTDRHHIVALVVSPPPGWLHALTSSSPLSQRPRQLQSCPSFDHSRCGQAHICRILLWQNWIFVWNFGAYLPFITISCESSYTIYMTRTKAAGQFRYLTCEVITTLIVQVCPTSAQTGRRNAHNVDVLYRPRSTGIPSLVASGRHRSSRVSCLSASAGCEAL